MTQKQNPANPTPKTHTEGPVTPEIIVAAEHIIGLTFTGPEREQMLDELNERLKAFARLREYVLHNEIAPALYFDPRPSLSSPAPIQRHYPISNQGKITRPANLEDIAFWPVTKLAALIRTRQVTSIELTEMYLSRLRKYDEHLECVITYTDDLAIKQATRADEEIASGHYRSALHGIPWGAKDLLATKDHKTTWGAAPYKDQTIDVDATVVQCLEEAGAVLIAKLTLGALAYGDIWFGGRTNNPWNLAEGSSGSSAGPGAATAAGLVGFSIGTETLGSIVSPSTRCGVTGLRPTFGRVSRHGAMALVWSMDKIGPMCRSVEDCALVFSAIYGPDGEDPTVVDLPFTWNPELNGKDLRVGYFKRAFEDKKCENGEAVLDVLRGIGIELIEIDLPQTPMEPLHTILLAEAASAFDEITRKNLDDLMAWQEDKAWPNTYRAARFIPAVEYIQANRIRTQLIRDMAMVMDQVDVFVTPSYGGNVLQITNFTGHPVVVLPNGFTETHTPSSISFVGGLYKEAEALAVAKAYQDTTDWHLQYPDGFT